MAGMDRSPYDLEPWHDLFVMVGGVAGALIGLLFVAISINLDRIITGANLPRRALETLAVLVSILTVAVLGLVPQPGWAIGIETLLLAGGVLALLVGRLRDAARPIEQRRFQDVPALVLAAFALPLVAAGLTLILGAGGGLYWLVPAMILGFGGAVLNAWVLLVEIVR
jgi:hypothetical protein